MFWGTETLFPILFRVSALCADPSEFSVTKSNGSFSRQVACYLTSWQHLILSTHPSSQLPPQDVCTSPCVCSTSIKSFFQKSTLSNRHAAHLRLTQC